MAKYRATEFIEKLPTDAKLVEGTTDYYVDTQGNVYSTARGRIKKMKPGKNRDGYLHVGIYYPQSDGSKVRKHKFVHVLVCKAFNYNDDTEHKTVVDHKNNNKTDNSAGNLQWCTQKFNVQKAWNDGVAKAFERTLEYRQKLSKAHIGTHHSEEHRKHLSEAQKKKSVKVIFNDNTELIFNSLTECADYLKVYKGHLCNYINGKEKFPKKYNVKEIYYL